MTHSILFTYGYQGSTPEQLVAYAREHRAMVLDIRYAPRSRDPRWNKLALRELLGNQYHWLQALGNLNYQGGPITIQDLAVGTRYVERLLEEQNVILLCACANWETCHRSLVAEHIFAQYGAPVIHLPAKAESSPAENTLKCITLTPPWSTLVMIGEKRNETRSWATSYRGLLGIHAAKGFPKDARALCYTEPFRSVLYAAGFAGPDDLPTAALLGTVRLVDCVPARKIRFELSEQELAFGNYEGDRWVWIFEDVKPFAEPIPMKGVLGLWTCSLPMEVVNG